MKCAPFLRVCCPAALSFLAAWGLQAAPPPELPSSLLDWQAYVEQSAGQVCRGFYLSPELDLPEPELSFDTARLFAESAEVRYSPQGGLSLLGDVRLRRGPIYLTADEASISADQNEVTLSGDLAVREEGLLLRADQGYYRLDQRFMQLQRAHYVLHEPRLRGSAWRLQQQPDGRVLLDDAALTSCAPEDQTWRLVAGKLALDRESGFGDAWHVRMEVHQVPVFYWPWLRFPIDDRRHTGLLSPSLSYSRSSGLDYLQPIYWNLAPNYDATFYPRYIADRGFMLGAEFRYLQPSDAGRLYYARLNGDERHGRLDRWHFEVAHQGQWGSQLSYQLDFGQVSDDRYFRDLGQGADDAVLSADDLSLLQQLRFDYHQGIWRSSLAWRGYQKLEPDRYSLPGDANPGPQYELLDLRSGRDARYQDYYYWPQFSLQGGDWLSEIWRWDLAAELSYFSKRFDADASPSDSWQSATTAAPDGSHYISRWGAPDALRLYLQPGLQGDWRWPWAYIRPQAYLQYTRYDLEPYWDAAALPQSVELQPAYTQPVFSLDTGLFLERDARWFGTSLLQTLEPRVYAAYVPFVEQYEIPNLFDSTFLEPDINQFFRAERIAGRDRTGDLEKVALGVTQRLIRTDSGQELASLTLAKEFYLSDRRIIDDQSRHPDDPGRSDKLPREQRPYRAVRDNSSLGLQVSWNLTSSLALRSELLWDDYFRKTESSATLLSYQPGQGIELGFGHSYVSNFVTGSYLGPRPDRDLLDGYSYTKRAEEQYYVTAVLPLNDYWRLFAKRSYDWKRDEKLDSITGVEYNSCCWQLQFVYRDWIRNPDTSPTQNPDGSFDGRERDYGFFVQVLFKQLGGVGQATRQLLQREIQGYTDRP